MDTNDHEIEHRIDAITKTCEVATHVSFVAK